MGNNILITFNWGLNHLEEVLAEKKRFVRREFELVIYRQMLGKLSN